jgi:hypothetical protein
VGSPHREKRKTTGSQRSGERVMKPMRVGTGTKMWVVASGVIGHSKSRRALSFSKASAPLQDDEESTALLFAGER